MWNHVDRATIDGSVLDLYERDGIHMIRVNGWELMNGECHDSEDVLGKLAATLSPNPQPQILLGGLGLGYTLASLIANLEKEAAITVAEVSEDVLRWFKRYTGPTLFEALPAYVRLAHCNVTTLLGAEPTWDLIVLDVDNGPQPLATRENATLYDEIGLKACWTSLKPSGILMVWSSFEDPAFEERARSVGFSVRVLPISIAGRPGPFHHIFVLSRDPLDRFRSMSIDMKIK
ncbi:hypothetical protein [Telmatospirillum sp.]|uniref:hypothetical protein n=1 Tax=Telmatospirillum sp. TaxID=2079197 RepID=UPI00284A3B18|nr:hypothetical protein [Telmatospirillum sp.]MDR3437838.1 hypothetical protein [Telmatospirillum sp.]